MYKNKKILCIIPARGNSEGLPGKNIKELLGKPLIAYTIEQAKASEYIDRIIVSTDSQKISGIAEEYGAETPFIRPKKLATNKTSTIDVLLHAMDWIEKKGKYPFDIVVLLHVTAPLRNTEDIDNSIELLFKGKADNVFSVTQSHRSPYFNMVEIDNNGKVKLLEKGDFATRQSVPQIFDMNSSIYVWKKDIFKEKKSIFLESTQVYIMPKERSIDIDDSLDFEIAEMILRKAI